MKEAKKKNIVANITAPPMPQHPPSGIIGAITVEGKKKKENIAGLCVAEADQHYPQPLQAIQSLVAKMTSLSPPPTIVEGSCDVVFPQRPEEDIPMPTL